MFRNLQRFIFTGIILWGGLVGLPVNVSAESDDSLSSLNFNRISPKKIKDEAVSWDEYIPPTYPDISKLYWRLGKFNINDDDAIDKFITINECQIYQDYSYNEIEWSKVREMMKKVIEKEIDNFPSHFYTLEKIELGQYHEDKRYFDIEPQYAIENVKKIQIAQFPKNEEVCGTVRVAKMEGYPADLAVNVMRPMSFRKVPMSHEMALYYLKLVDEKFDQLSDRERASRYKRDVYLRSYFSLYSYEGTEKHPVKKTDIASVMGHLDRIEVYADRDLTKLLYKKDVSRAGPRGSR